MNTDFVVSEQSNNYHDKYKNIYVYLEEIHKIMEDLHNKRAKMSTELPSFRVVLWLISLKICLFSFLTNSHASPL